MAIDFPASPVLNQQFSAANSSWVFDGTAWNIVPQMVPAVASDTPPANPAVGQFWWRASNGQLYVYYVDPGGPPGQWVQAAASADVIAEPYTFKTANMRLSSSSASAVAFNSKADGSGSNVVTIDSSGKLTASSIINPSTSTSNCLVVGHAGNDGSVVGVSGFCVDPQNGAIFENSIAPINANKLGSNGVAVQFFQSGTACGSITVANATSTAYNTSSDERLKTFIGPYDPQKAIDIIRADPVRDFTWTSNGEYAVGWGAQTSYEISPDLASPPPESLPDTPWGIDQGRRTPYLWAALTWALDRIDDLETRLATLEAKP